MTNDLPSDDNEFNIPTKPLEAKERERQGVEDWLKKAKSHPLLKDYFITDDERIIKRKYYGLLKYAVIIFGALVLILAFFGYYGYLTPELNCNNTCPDVPPCPTCPENQQCSLICPNSTYNCPDLACGNLSCSEVNVYLNETG